MAGASIAGDAALIGDEQGVVTALSLADGSVQWKAELSDAITATPIVSGDLLLVPVASDGGSLSAMSLNPRR